MTISGSTSSTSLIYIPGIPGGGGIYGIPASPDLQALIFPISVSPSLDLTASIDGVQPIPTYSTHTYTPDNIVYTNFLPGGIGIVGVSTTPDLLGFIQANTNRISSGEGDLTSWIIALRSGISDLGGYIRPASSGEDTIFGSIQTMDIKGLTGVITPKYSGSEDLFGNIEAIPPVDLYGQLLGLITEDLYGEVESIEPINLSGTVSGQPYSDLLSSIYGFDSSDLITTYSGFYRSDLYGQVVAINSGIHILSGSIKGYLGIDQTSQLGGYIRVGESGQTSISGHILAMQYSDLYGRIRGDYREAADLSGTIFGDIKDTLIGIIDAAGSYSDLKALLHAASGSTLSLVASIDGTCVADLIGEIETDTTNYLYGMIQAAGPEGLNLYATVTGSTVTDLLGQYEGIFGNTLSGSISAIPGVGLYGIIEPKVFYLDSYIPINTYLNKPLKAIINATNCRVNSNFSDLKAFIHGTNEVDLHVEVVGVAGQYALVEDTARVLFKELIQIENKSFLIYRPPALIENSVPVVLTNSPLSDLVGIITGVYPSMDLRGEINARYIPPVSRDGVPVGEWINTSTGESKVVRISFYGNAANFYYSTSGNTTYAGDPEDYLKLMVEVYKKSDQEGSLLQEKQGVRNFKIDKLDEFKSIDEAIKYGIMYAASEIYSPLTAKIIGVGHTEELLGTVSGIDTNHLRDLQAHYTSVATDPVISGTITSKGSLDTLGGKISSHFSGQSNSLFIDTSGVIYSPSLFPNDSEGYSVILTTHIDLDTMNSISSRPDLWSTISGIAAEDLNAVISGL